MTPGGRREDGFCYQDTSALNRCVSGGGSEERERNAPTQLPGMLALEWGTAGGLPSIPRC